MSGEKTEEHSISGNTSSNQEDYREESFVKEEDEEGQQRPELSIPLKERKLVTQPFDFIVSSLEQQIKDNSLLLQDEFQRRRVWDDTKSSRLIESLLLNVPIPESKARADNSLLLAALRTFAGQLTSPRLVPE